MRRLLALASLSVLAACAAVPAPRPAPPVPVPTPAPPPPPAPAPVPSLGSDWRDWPVTPGNWTYRTDGQGSVATFGTRIDSPELTLRCDRAARQIHLSRRGVTTGAMTIRTSTTARALVARPAANGEMGVALAAGDTILDAIGYSRGRFVVEMPPLAPLVVPTWAEVQRVTEDCRR